MFCPKCGNQMPDGAQFCAKCGNSMNAAPANQSAQPQSEPAPAAAQQPVAQPNVPMQNAKKGLSISPAIIGGIIGAVVLVLVVIILAATHKTTLKLDDYVTVEFEGYDTVGNARLSFDKEAFVDKYAKKVKANKGYIKKRLKEEYGSAMTKEALKKDVERYAENGADIIADVVRYDISLDNNSNLSNGDSVVASWNIGDIEEIEQMYKCKFKYSDSTFTVAGLEQVAVFNPFDGIEVEFSGMAPDGSAHVSYDSYDDERSYLNYDISKRDGLSNGDEITVTVSIGGDKNRFIERFGKIPSPTEQTYTVEGLMSYILSSSDMPSDLLTKMQNQAEDIIKSKAANQYNDKVSISDMTYIGNYFLTKKGDATGNTRVYLIYKLTAEMTMENEEEGVVVEDKDFYYYVCFYNPMLDVDGTGAVDISRYDYAYNNFRYESEHLDGRWYNFSTYLYGYEKMDEIYNEIVTKNLESYAHEDNISE